MHLDWSISLGQIVITVPIFWLIVMMGKVYNMLLRFRIEHETLMRDWAQRQIPPVRLEELPTRQSHWW